MWMIEHPGTEEEEDLHPGGGGSDSSLCPGASGGGGGGGGGGGKSLDRSSYLLSPGEIPNADAAEMEEGFSERYNTISVGTSS